MLDRLKALSQQLVAAGTIIGRLEAQNEALRVERDAAQASLAALSDAQQEQQRQVIAARAKRQ